MKILDQHEAFAELCKATRKWGVAITLDRHASPEEVLKAAPYLSIAGNAQVLADGYAVILCDDGPECDRVYALTVGDDGPTALNPYAGPARVYALTCSPDGQLMNENT